MTGIFGSCCGKDSFPGQTSWCPYHSRSTPLLDVVSNCNLYKEMIDWMLTEMPVGWEEMVPDPRFIKIAIEIRENT